VDRLLKSSISDSGYISEKKREEGNYTPELDEEECTLNGDVDEDPYRWVILFSGFLAQAISMCTLSSW
jgi:hypothetical protein